MTPSKQRIAIAIWAPDAKDYDNPAVQVLMLADNPGATALQNAIASIGPNSDATQIKQAMTTGFNQLDVARVLPEPEMPASEAPKSLGDAIEDSNGDAGEWKDPETKKSVEHHSV